MSHFYIHLPGWFGQGPNRVFFKFVKPVAAKRPQSWNQENSYRKVFKANYPTTLGIPDHIGYIQTSPRVGWFWDPTVRWGWGKSPMFPAFPACRVAVLPSNASQQKDTNMTCFFPENQFRSSKTMDQHHQKCSKKRLIPSDSLSNRGHYTTPTHIMHKKYEKSPQNLPYISSTLVHPNWVI